MISLNNPSSSFELQDLIRPLLILNNVIAMSLSFPVMTASFVVLGSILVVSTVFTFFAWVRTGLSKRSKATSIDEIKRPSLLILAIELLGVLAFCVMYVVTTIETADNAWGWRPTLLMAYASIGGLVAL